MDASAKQIDTTFTWVNSKDRKYLLEHGTEFSVIGLRGRFSFIQHVATAAGNEWIDCFGGTTSRVMSRSFHPDRISKVYAKAAPKKARATASPKKRHGLPI
jgi:hypothetical protein